MGGSQSKKKVAFKLPEAKRINIFKMFDVVNRERVPPISHNMIQKLWKDIFSERILELILRYFFKASSNIDVEELELFFYKMVEGTTKDRAQLLIDVLGIENCIPTGCFETYVSDLIESYIVILRKRHPDVFSSWVSGDLIQKSDLNIVTEFFLRDMKYSDEKVDVTELEHWLMHCVFVNDIFESVMKYAFNMEIEEMVPIFPRANNYSSVLSVPLVLALSHLINPHMKKEWRLLYSSLTDAQSWNILHGKIAKQGPTIVLVEDAAGPLFGGFASQSWKICPSFYGDECCFLFRLRPKMEVCPPTGYNSNFQYLNLGAATLPNGLGMGGQLNYFSFFLDSEFGPGTVSKTCTTFRDYVPLASKSDFLFSKLEIWAVGSPDMEEENVRRTSGLIMDRDPGAAAILEIVGKSGYSKNVKQSVDDE